MHVLCILLLCEFEDYIGNVMFEFKFRLKLAGCIALYLEFHNGFVLGIRKCLGGGSL